MTDAEKELAAWRSWAEETVWNRCGGLVRDDGGAIDDVWLREQFDRLLENSDRYYDGAQLFKDMVDEAVRRRDQWLAGEEESDD